MRLCVFEFPFAEMMKRLDCPEMHKNFGLKISFGFFMLVCLSVVNTEELWTCQDGEQMTVYDKIPDYKEVVLLFYTHEKKTNSNYTLDTVINTPNWYDKSKPEEFYKTYSQFNLTGVLLSNEEEFSITISPLNETYSPLYDVSIIPSYDKFDIFHSDKVSSISKNGFICTTSRLTGAIKYPVFDWETSSVYYISGSRIRECDKNIVMCVDVKSEFIKHPMSLTISQKNKQLFWIERRSIESDQFYLYKYDLKSSSSARIAQNLKSSKWLTVDTARDRVYWMDAINNITCIMSTSFDGFNRHIVLPGIPIPKNSSSFAVHDNILYWPDKEQNKIMKCSVNDCEYPTVLKSFSSAEYLDFDHLVLDHRHSVTSKKVKNKLLNNIHTHMCIHVSNHPHTAIGCPTTGEGGHFPVTMNQKWSISEPLRNNTCFYSSYRSESCLYCSHFCAESESTLSCYCPNIGDREATSVGQSNPFCVDETMVAVYKNFLYIIGLARSTLIGKVTPIIRRVELNISSISALAYASINGSIIVAEMEKQRFYSWLPQGDGEIELIIDNGPGNVEVLCVDDLTNNLYWIDTTNHSITVVNLNTRNMVNVFKGNSSYSPFGLLLVSEKGYMFVSVLKNNSSVVIERISMDGQPESRKIIREIYGARIGDVFLLNLQIPRHRDLSINGQRLYCLFDRRRNEIKIYTDTYSDFLISFSEVAQIPLGTINGIKDIVFYFGYLLISGNNGNLTLLDRGSDKATIIRLGIPTLRTSNGILRVIPISKSINVYNSHAVECLRPSYGDCELNEVCLNSENYPSFICASNGTGKNTGNDPVDNLISKMISNHPQPPQSSERSNSLKKSFTTLEICALIILPITFGVFVSEAILWCIFWKWYGEKRKFVVQLSKFRENAIVSMEEETCLWK